MCFPSCLTTDRVRCMLAGACLNSRPTARYACATSDNDLRDHRRILRWPVTSLCIQSTDTITVA